MWNGKAGNGTRCLFRRSAHGPAALVRGDAAAKKRRHAHILLLADEDRGGGGGLSDADIATVFGVGRATVECVRKQCVLEGIGAALEPRKQVNRQSRKLDGESKLVALACSEPPAGHARCAATEACGVPDRGTASVRRRLGTR